MKIAVVTLHRIHNYGSVLQAYATQRILENLGHDVQVVDYITPQRTRKKLYGQPPAAASCGGVKGKLLHGAKIASLMLRDVAFGHFLNRHLNLTKQYITAEDLEKEPPEADLYITGSDQVWNSATFSCAERYFDTARAFEQCLSIRRWRVSSPRLRRNALIAVMGIPISRTSCTRALVMYATSLPNCLTYATP